MKQSERLPQRALWPEESFNPEMMVLARELRGLTQSELATRAGVSQGHLSKIEHGGIAPNGKVLADLADALDLPERFFYLQDRVYGPSVSELYHRKRKSASQKALDRLHANINVHRMTLARFLRSLETPAVNIPRHDPDEFNGDIEEIARAVRAAWQLPKGPVKHLLAAIEDAGAVVFRFDFGTPLVDAVSWWLPSMPPMIFLNDIMPADRERLTVAHELGHLVMHQAARPEIEDEANAFAREFLMPANEIRPYLRDASLATLANLKPYWRVSMQALLVQAQRTTAINDGRSEYLWAAISKAGYKRREPPELDFPKEPISTLAQLVTSHVHDLDYTLDDFAKLFPMKAHELAQRYNIQPKRAAPTLRVVR